LAGDGPPTSKDPAANRHKLATRNRIGSGEWIFPERRFLSNPGDSISLKTLEYLLNDIYITEGFFKGKGRRRTGHTGTCLHTTSRIACILPRLAPAVYSDKGSLAQENVRRPWSLQENHKGNRNAWPQRQQDLDSRQAIPGENRVEDAIRLISRGSTKAPQHRSDSSIRGSVRARGSAGTAPPATMDCCSICWSSPRRE